MTGLGKVIITEVLKNGKWLFSKANHMTCCRKSQLIKDVVIISEDFLSLVPFRMYICFEWPY